MAQPATFPDLTNSDQPIVFKINTVPPKPKLQMSLSFMKAELRLSVDLYKLLELGSAQRVAFVTHKGSYYLTRYDQTDGFLVHVARLKNGGINSTMIYNKAFIEQLRVEWGHEPGDLVRVPMASYQVQASELRLDPAQYPHPFYRLATDQKTVRPA